MPYESYNTCMQKYKSISQSIFVLSFFCLSLFSHYAAAEQPQPQAKAQLVAEQRAIQAHQKFWVGIYLTMADGWHTYWKNPGDSGLQTQIEWSLPSGWKAGAIQWPVPSRIEVPPLINYGYDNQALLLVQIQPSGFKTPNDVTLKGKVTWMACKNICIPFTHNISLKMPVQTDLPAFDTNWKPRFDAVRNAVTEKPTWKTSLQIDNAQPFLIVSTTQKSSTPAEITFFPDSESHVEGAVFSAKESSDPLRITLKKSAYTPEVKKVTGLLVVTQNKVPQAFYINHQVVQAAAPIWTILFFALIGGLILNLMPCVFPVIAIKVAGFVKQAGKPAEIRKHGLTFVFGILFSFWVLATILVVLNSAGHAIGWGFQLQSPVFVAALSILFFVMGLNFLGAFEVGASFAGMGDKLARKSGYAGSFFSGMLTTIVATPCTAPFMGTALGFTLGQPAYVTMTVFTALALGVSLPYLLLAFFPKLLRFLPKPGTWMVTLKQALAFPLFATVIWLIWVLGAQIGVDGVTWFLSGFLTIALIVWLTGKTQTRSKVKKIILWILIAALLAIGTLFIANGLNSSVKQTVQTRGDTQWLPYSDNQLNILLKDHRPVFVNFTAAWCVTCQVNERVTFRSDEVKKKFAELGIVMMKADWTSYNPEITRTLAGFGRNGVPLYVLYTGKEENSTPQILPEVLTPGVMLAKLNETFNK